MANKSTNRRYLKYFLITIFLLPVLILLIIIGNYFLKAKLHDYKLHKLNNIDIKDLTQTYINDTVGFSFNFPKNGNVYKWYGNDENNLRVFSEGSNKGYTCDIHINGSRRVPNKPTEAVYYNEIVWTKWKDIDNTGSIFDSHFVSWYTKKGENKIAITGIIEVEGYCESIVSTFKFTE